MKQLPNILTISRILVIPVIVVLFFFPSHWATWLCGVLFILAAITDYFDGYFARSMNQVSSFGRFLDPIADKLLVASVLFMLVATRDDLHSHLFWELPALIILCREIIVSGLREYLAEIRVSMPVTRLAKWKTGFQMTAIPVIIFSKEFSFFVDTGIILLWIAAVLTMITGYDYLRAGMKYMNTEPAPIKKEKGKKSE